jgi:hypothetical protein
VLHLMIVFVVLQIQDAKNTRPVVLSSLACPTLPYFAHYLINGTIIGGKIY